MRCEWLLDESRGWMRCGWDEDIKTKWEEWTRVTELGELTGEGEGDMMIGDVTGATGLPEDRQPRMETVQRCPRDECKEPVTEAYRAWRAGGKKWQRARGRDVSSGSVGRSLASLL